jgi:hypothetical protein
LEQNDSEEDMFGDYDSFAENSLLAQVDDLEQKFMQLPEHETHAADFATEDLCSENIKNKLSITTVSNCTEYKTDLHTKNQSEHEDVPLEPSDDLLYAVPSSQVLFFENLQNSSNDLGDRSIEEKDRNSFSYKTMNEELLGHIEEPQQSDEFSSKVRTSSDMNRRKSVKDHLKSAMTVNAKAQTPVFSKSKQLKEKLLSKEINVAKKAIESPSDDRGPFYSLPSKVRDLYVQLKGIEKLYGNAFAGMKAKIFIITIYSCKLIEASDSTVVFLILKNQTISCLSTFHLILPYWISFLPYTIRPVILAISISLSNSAHFSSGFHALTLDTMTTVCKPSDTSNDYLTFQ